MDFLREEVVASYLRYGAVAQPLRSRAYAQLVAKVLLLDVTGNYLSVEKLRGLVSSLVGGATPSREDVEAALTLLAGQEAAEDRNKKWRLRRKARDVLVAQVGARRDRVSSVLRRHFPGDIEPAVLHRWFDATCVEFFRYYGDRWVHAVTRRTPVCAAGEPALSSVVVSCAAAHKLDVAWSS